MRRKSPLVLTTGVGGSDGLSLLSREIVLALRGYEPGSLVEVWSLTDGSFDDCPVRSAHGSRLVYGAWGIAAACSKPNARIVVTAHAHLLPASLPLVLSGARLVHFLVGIEAWKPLSRLQSAALARAERVVAISAHTATAFRGANPAFATAEIEVCHPGLSDLEKASDEGEGDFALVVGRMSSAERYKGHDLLLEIWGDVTKAHPRARLVVAGGGDDRSRLEAKAIHLGLENLVEFVGHVSDADLMRLYRTCAFFVMPSSGEGFGFVFVEAMRAGKACVGGVGAPSELIEDGATGFVVDPEDPGAVKAAVARLWGSPELRESMGSRGRARFLAQFTRARFQKRLRGLLPPSVRRTTSGGTQV